MKNYNLAIVGATGNVGREILNILDQRSFPVKELHALASKKSEGTKLTYGDDKEIIVEDLEKFNFKNTDIVLSSPGSNVSKKFVPMATKAGSVVIDNTSLFRMNKDIPLIVPEANIASLKNFKSGIISNPNCCTIPLVVALKPLDNATKIKRLVISTYQSVSGAGKDAMDELYNQTKAKFVFQQLDPKILPNQIAFNLFPHVGDFRDDGYTDEEYKIDFQARWNDCKKNKKDASTVELCKCLYETSTKNEQIVFFIIVSMLTFLVMRFIFKIIKR